MRRVSQSPTVEMGKLVYLVKPLESRRASFQTSLAATKAYLDDCKLNDSHKPLVGCPRSFFKVIDGSSSTIEERRREVKMMSAKFREVADEVLSRRKAQHDALLQLFNRRNGDIEDESELSESLNWAGISESQ